MNPLFIEYMQTINKKSKTENVSLFFLWMLSTGIILLFPILIVTEFVPFEEMKDTMIAGILTFILILSIPSSLVSFFFLLTSQTACITHDGIIPFQRLFSFRQKVLFTDIEYYTMLGKKKIKTKFMYANFISSIYPYGESLNGVDVFIYSKGKMIFFYNFPEDNLYSLQLFMKEKGIDKKEPELLL